MLTILKVIHIYALMAGAAASFGNLAIMAQVSRLDGPPPPVVPTIMGILARMGLWGIVLLWVTGPLLAWIEYGTLALGAVFYLKLLAAAAVFGLVMYMAKLRADAMREKRPPDMARMKSLAQITAAAVFVAVVTAVIVFN